MSSTEQVYIQRSEEFEARRDGTYSKTGGMTSVGSVVSYASNRQSDSDFQIKYDLAELQRQFDDEIPDDVLDLVEIAVATFGVDRYIERNIIAGADIDDVDARLNTRSIVIRVPVFTPSLATPNAQELLSTIVSHMTYDVVQFDLVQHPKTTTHTSSSFGTPTTTTDAVSLFSDGLDSAGGVNQNQVENIDSEYVSLNYGSGLGSRHKELQQLLDVTPHIFKLDYEEETNEYTTFSRGFLHWVFAAATATAYRIPQIRAFETGLMARFAILNEGWHTTRTVSPIAIDLFNTLLTDVLNWNTSVRNPFLTDTKCEVVNRISSPDVVRTAVSCPHHGRQGQFDLDNCGQCAPCIIRNTAILTSRFDIPAEDLSICDWSNVDFEDRKLPDKTPYELPHRNDRDTFFLALGEIAHLCRLLRKQDPSTVVTEYPKLASKEIYDLHNRFAAKFTQAFQELAGENSSIQDFMPTNIPK
jgi:7-cyano-7-deazaguanine synthase in queuosine biosynthesis